MCGGKNGFETLLCVLYIDSNRNIILIIASLAHCVLSRFTLFRLFFIMFSCIYLSCHFELKLKTLLNLLFHF